ncbi:MAG: CDP-alcohol phosphatidyltransferase family protein [Candidatus Thorarchaeota archaeon]|nr:CDP-alcohol phosphatidyltransferase family protein [Candidatus Thorarchaeota archaeon]
MTSKFRLRRVFRGVVLAIARPLVRVGVRPDTVTYFSLFTALLAALALLLTHNGFLYGILVFITGLLDGVDGAVARLGGRSSPAGPFIDSVIDKVSETLIILAVALTYPSQMFYGVSVPTLSVLCVSGWLLTSYTRSRAESLGVTDLNVGLGARSERLFTLFLFSVFDLVDLGLVVVTLLGISTAAYRYHHYTREIAQASVTDA